MAHPKKTDAENLELMEAYSVLAKAALNNQNARLQQAVADHPEAIKPSTPDTIPGAPYVYSVSLQLSGLFWVSITVQFHRYNDLLGPVLATFRGDAGGIYYGDTSALGTAQFNYDVTFLAQNHWQARFEGNLVAVFANLNFWGMHGEVIGSIFAGGLGPFGIIGGQGDFS